jgi:conjugal transfer ATP-binding protein TraC
MSALGMFKNLAGDLGDLFHGARGMQPYPLPNADDYREQQFSNWLPYIAYDIKTGIFVNQDSIAFCLEVMPQTGANMEMAQVLTSLYASLPDWCGIQITLHGSPHLRAFYQRYGGLRISDVRPSGYVSPLGREERHTNPFRQTVRRRIDYLKKAARSPLAPTVGSLLRHYRCFVSVTLPGNPSDLRWMDNLKLIRVGFQSTLKSAGLINRVWQPVDLINWCADLVNVERLYEEGVWLEYDDRRMLRDQIVSRDMHMSVRTDRLVQWKEGVQQHAALRALAVKNYPKSYALWNMSALIGDVFQGTQQYACPFTITMGAMFRNRDTVKNHAQMKQARATQNVASKMARFMPQFGPQKHDWDMAVATLDRGGTLTDMYHHVVLHSDNENLARDEQTARAIWAAKGFDLTTIERLQLPLFMSTLPMTFGQGMFKDLNIFKLVNPKTSENAVHLAPVIAEWSGTPTPALVLAGRRGQIITLDFFDNKSGNYNVAIAGASGSGKSVFSNDILSSYASLGSRVWIIDIGRSYENLCEHLGGEFIEFKSSNKLCINPFTFVIDMKEEMELMQPLIAQMASPKGEIDNYSYAVIGQAISKVWSLKGKDSTITDIYDLCRRGHIDDDQPFDQRIADLSTLLFNYTVHGAYGAYFNGPANIAFRNNFTVLELEELNSKKDLRAVVLFLMMYRITHDMYLSPRDQRKLVMIDEAWDLLGTVSGSASAGESSASAKFIDAGYRRARKYGGAFITATQNITDFDMSPAAQSALKNSDWRCYLRQKSESLDELKRKGSYENDPGFVRSLEGLRTEEGVFSEIMVSGPGVRCVTRNYIDPYNLLMWSSKPADFMAVRDRRARGMSLDQAIHDVLRERGLA